MLNISRVIEKIEKRTPIINNCYYARYISKRLRLSDNNVKSAFDVKVINPGKDKAKQISKLIDSLDIFDYENSTFFYSLDPCKIAVVTRGTTTFDNFTPNYTKVIFDHLREDDALAPALKRYIDKASIKCNPNHKNRIEDLKLIFQRPALSFIDALQRILFINQLFWQTEHTLVGVGHLDWWLIDLYRNDLSKGDLDNNIAKEIIKDFMRAIHSNYEYKSNSLVGDTGQIIILGGVSKEGYKYNELTYLILEALCEMHLPDPKIMLRCGKGMPDNLFQLAVRSIATGIGSPLLSNDDLIVPAMIKYGYSENDAYEYGVSACWEPLVIGKSFDNNNCSTINFAYPLCKAINDSRFLLCKSLDDVFELYFGYLKVHIQNIIKAAQARVYDDDPLNNMLIDQFDDNKTDFCKGGAVYSNTGFTSVGMATVVNSFLNIKHFVFADNCCSLADIQNSCNQNFVGFEELQKKFKMAEPRFGSDDDEVVAFTNRIMAYASAEIGKHKTQYGGGYKIGFSSPNYINMGNITKATPDGRKAKTPFATHISCDYGVAYTELMNFAAQLKYDDNCFNGNVVDFMVSGSLIKNNMDEFTVLLWNALNLGVFQTQVNIVDSDILIDAQKQPEKHRDLIVRVWGFSAYFNDLPQEYQDVLIARTIESEKVS